MHALICIYIHTDDDGSTCARVDAVRLKNHIKGKVVSRVARPNHIGQVRSGYATLHFHVLNSGLITLLYIFHSSANS